MRRPLAVPLPKGVYRVRNATGREYWYFQAKRGTKEAGERVKLPEYGTPEFWREIAALAGDPISLEGKISSLIGEYQASPRWTALRPNSRRTYRFALDAIKASWGHLHASQVTPRGAAALIDSISDKPPFANLTLAVVRLLMKEAIRKGYRDDNPAREIERVDVSPDEAKPLTIEAWAALMQAPDDIRRYAVLGRATGQRISDVLRISPKNRDQNGLAITITKLKDKAHWCPLNAAQIAEIDGWKQFPGAPYIMRPDGKRHTAQSFRDAWNAWIATDPGASCRGFTSHDLRATKVCDERISGKSHQQIAAIVGMSIGMVAKYSRHIDQRLAATGHGTRTEQD